MRHLREFFLRLAGTLYWRRSDADIEEELRSHLAFAEEEAQRRGAPIRDARLRAGNVSPAVDGLRDQSHLAWLDAIRLDSIFAWRQLNRHRAANAVAILSLGLAIGATAAAVRLVDAVLLRPLPVADPSRLFAVTIEYGNRPTGETRDDLFDYPTYRAYAQAIGDRAQPLVVGTAARQLVVVQPGNEPEPAFRQYVSGNLFGVLGLQPATGRLLTPGDDDPPGAHPVTVVSYDWWTRRFGADPAVIGRTIRVSAVAFEIVGVAPKGFTGTEPGTVTDLFVPATMNIAALNSPGWSWFRLWVRPAQAGGAVVEQLLQARFPKDVPRLVSAAAGASAAQKTFRRPLIILAALAALVLLVACANVANLLSARTVTRAREMSLRISIGAGRGRLIQLVLIESLMLAVIASVVGALFASQASPIVIALLAQPDRPVRLVLDAGWRALGFGVVLTVLVTMLFGVVPALRASAAKPVDALKATGTPRGPGVGSWILIALQVTFSTFLLVAAALFGTTLSRLLSRPLGFSDQGVLLLTVEAAREQSAATWTDASRSLRDAAGVESAAVAGWAPLSGNRWHGEFRAPGSDRVAQANLLDVGPSYFDALHIGMVDGRDFAAGERDVAIVNEAFARALFDGGNPVGRRVLRHVGKDSSPTPVTIVGLVRDAVYMSVRESPPPTIYVPLEARSGGTLIVRTAGSPASMVQPIRRALAGAYPALRVRAAERFGALVEQQMVRERLLAALSTFFATVALLIAGLGLYGVLNGTVVRQRREIGVRIALGAKASDIVRRIAARTAIPVALGAVAGLAAGVVFGRAARSLLFEIVPGQPASLLVPALALVAAFVAAVLPPAVRASRIDPATTLRSE